MITRSLEIGSFFVSDNSYAKGNDDGVRYLDIEYIGVSTSKSYTFSKDTKSAIILYRLWCDGYETPSTPTISLSQGTYELLANDAYNNYDNSDRDMIFILNDIPNGAVISFGNSTTSKYTVSSKFYIFENN